MIDPDARSDLACAIDQLVAGEPGAFLDRFDRWFQSEDRGVREIVTILSDCCLDGGHIDCDRKVLDRVVLFLHSGGEYEWPDSSEVTLISLTTGCAIFFGIPGAIALSIIAMFLLGQSDYEGVRMMVPLIALLIIFVASALVMLRREETEFAQSGNFEAWPFIRTSDLDGSRTES